MLEKENGLENFYIIYRLFRDLDDLYFNLILLPLNFEKFVVLMQRLLWIPQQFLYQH